MREAELHDGTVLEFPDNTPDEVIQRTVKRQLGVKDDGINSGLTPASNPSYAVPIPGILNDPQAVKGVAGNLGGTAASIPGRVVEGAAGTVGKSQQMLGTLDKETLLKEKEAVMSADVSLVPFDSNNTGETLRLRTMQRMLLAESEGNPEKLTAAKQRRLAELNKKLAVAEQSEREGMSAASASDENMKAIRPADEGVIGRAFGTAAESAAPTIAGLSTAAITRSPTAAFAVGMGGGALSAAASSYTDALQKGEQIDQIRGGYLTAPDKEAYVRMAAEKSKEGDVVNLRATEAKKALDSLAVDSELGKVTPEQAELRRTQILASFEKGFAEHVTPEKARAVAKIDAVLEALGERLTLGVALKPGTAIYKRILHTMAAEGGQEFATQIMQDANEYAQYNPNISMKEFMTNALEAAAAGAIGGTAFGAAGHGAQKFEEYRQKMNDAQIIEQALSGEGNFGNAEKQALNALHTPQPDKVHEVYRGKGAMPAADLSLDMMKFGGTDPLSGVDIDTVLPALPGTIPPEIRATADYELSTLAGRGDTEGVAQYILENQDKFQEPPGLLLSRLHAEGKISWEEREQIYQQTLLGLQQGADTETAKALRAEQAENLTRLRESGQKPVEVSNDHFVDLENVKELATQWAQADEKEQVRLLNEVRLDGRVSLNTFLKELASAYKGAKTNKQKTLILQQAMLQVENELGHVQALTEGRLPFRFYTGRGQNMRVHQAEAKLILNKYTPSATSQVGARQATDAKAGQTIVYGHAGPIAENIKNVFQKWQQKFLPGHTIYVVDENVIAGLGGRWTERTNGQWRKVSETEHVIGIRSSLFKEGDRHAAVVMAHEFGHAMMRAHFENSPADVKEALLRAWEQDVHDHWFQTLAQFSWNTADGRGTPGGMKMGAALEVGRRDIEHFETYFADFDEWLAHGTERMLMSDYEGMTQPVKTFFQKLYQKIKQWFDATKNDFNPNETLGQFLTYHRLRIQEEGQKKEANLNAQLALDRLFPEMGARKKDVVYAQMTRVLQALEAPPTLLQSFDKAPRSFARRFLEVVKLLGISDAQLVMPSPRVPNVAEALTWVDAMEAMVMRDTEGKAIQGPQSILNPPKTMLGKQMASMLKGFFGGTKDTSAFQTDLDKMGWYRKGMFTLLQVAKSNPHITELYNTRGDGYINLVRKWDGMKMEWVTRADDHLKAWQRQTAKDRQLLGKYMLDQTVGEKWLDLQDPAVRAQYPLSDEAVEVYNKINGDFQDFINAMENTLVSAAQKRLSHNVIAFAAELKGIQEKFNKMRSKPYFPLSRFGRYSIVVRATGPTTVKGKTYKAGEVIHFETFDSEAIRDLAKPKIQGLYPSGKLHPSQIDDATYSLMQLPTPLLDAMKSDPSMALTPDQKKRLDELIHYNTPDNSFLKHMIERKGIEGYSEDARRAYATYFSQAAGHLARITYGDELKKAVQLLKETARSSDDGTKRMDVVKYMEAHLDYIMNPPEDWGKFRSFVAVGQLGFSAVSALMNMTQVPLVTFAKLSSQYGSARASKQILKAYTDFKKAFTATKTLSKAEQDALDKAGQGLPLTPAEQRFVDQWSGLKADERRMLEEAHKENWLEGGQAAELAGVAEGNAISKFRVTSRLGYAARSFTNASMFMFQSVEKLNRRVTALAAYRLAREGGMPHHQAYTMARDAVDDTQFEMSRWNRPSAMRGRSGVFMMFMQYQLNMLYFAFGGDKGFWRWWLLMLAAVGPMGLPGMENMMDLVYWVEKQAFPNNPVNPRYLAKKYAEEFAEILHVHPDLLLHGASRFGFGLVPWADFSNNLSMGRLIPGTDVLASNKNGADAVEGMVTEMGGASMTVLANVAAALFGNHPDTARRVEQAMPVAAVKRAMQAIRWADRGAYETWNGADLVKFDTEDPQHAAELIGKGLLGMQPGAVAMGRPEQGQPGTEQTYLQKDIGDYYRARKMYLMNRYDYMHQRKDAEGLRGTLDDIRKYNKQTGAPSMRISAEQLKASIVNRNKNRAAMEHGTSTKKSEASLFSRIQNGTYGEPRDE